MKTNVKYGLLALLMSPVIFSCEKDEEPSDPPVQVNKTSIVSATTNGRPNEILGCVEISKRDVTIYAWDHGTVDGDIISLYVNNTDRIMNAEELDGPSNKSSVRHTFSANGYNSLTLYAHNEGDISPNTAAINIDGTEFVLNANLSTNGAVNVIVTGYGVDCNSGSGGGGGGGSSKADFTVYTTSDLGCGNISVTLDGVGTRTISSYYSSGVTSCGANGCANFSDIPYGVYSYSGSCSGYTWSGTITIDDSCELLRFTL